MYFESLEWITQPAVMNKAAEITLLLVQSDRAPETEVTSMPVLDSS
jgi:hypothetical protein